MDEKDLSSICNIIQTLNNIQVPTLLIESVALPVRNCSIVLEQLYKKYTTEKTNNESKPEDGGPVITDVEVGT